jgi:hypothetical protein
LAIGFAAGFIATLVFHQIALMMLVGLGLVKAAVYSMQAVPPFGVPQVLSLSFWGGMWGMFFALIENRFPKGAGYWLAALLFGAIGPTLVAWFIVAPLKGQPVAAGWELPRMITGLVVNGAWGIGTGLLIAAAHWARRPTLLRRHVAWRR